MVGRSVRSLYEPEVATAASALVSALALSAACTAVLTGLFASEVLSTFPRPTSDFVSVTVPVLPETEVTDAVAFSLDCTALVSFASLTVPYACQSAETLPAFNSPVLVWATDRYSLRTSPQVPVSPPG